MIRIIDSDEGGRIYDVRYFVDFKDHIKQHHFRDALVNHECVSGGINFTWKGFHNEHWFRYTVSHKIELNHGQKLDETDRQQVSEALYQLWQELSVKYKADNVDLMDMNLKNLLQQ